MRRQQKRSTPSTSKKRPAMPRAFDNSWLGNTVTHARIQEIDDSIDPPRWKTLGECIDTPNAIAQELRDPKYRGHDVWIRNAFGDRRYHGHVR